MTRITTDLREQMTRFHQLQSRLRDIQAAARANGTTVLPCLATHDACQQELKTLLGRLVPELEQIVKDEATAALAQLLVHLERAAEANATLQEVERFASEASSVAGRMLISENMSWHELSREGDSRYTEWLRHLPNRFRQAAGDEAQQSGS